MFANLALFFKHFSATLLSLVRIGLLSRPVRTLPGHGTLKPLLILGNGPSLTQSIDELGDTSPFELMAVNFFADTDLFDQLKPGHYVVAAPEFWLDGMSESWLANRKRLFSHLETKTSWAMNLFIPIASRSFLWKNTNLRNHAHIRLCFYNPTPVEGWGWFRTLGYSLGLGMPRPHNVLIPSVLLAVRMRFPEVFLLGADHSWLPQITVNERNEVLINQQHFYDTQSSRPETMKKLGRDTRRLHEVLHKFMLSFEGYFLLKAFAETRGVRIWNATPRSFIDAFDRQSVHELKTKLHA